MSSRYDANGVAAQIMRVVVFIGAVCLAYAAQAQTPYTGTPAAVPGTFQAENFDLGGEGIAYHDNLAGNAGGLYRTAEDVDIIAGPQANTYVVNNFETGEWLTYTINVAATSQYDIQLRASSMFSNSAFRIEIDGVNVSGTVNVPNTGGWNTFQWVGKSGIQLTAGTHQLRIVAEQQYFNLDQIKADSGNLLFKSGFTGVSFKPINPSTDCYDTGCWQEIIGTDSVTGYTWPPRIWSNAPNGRFQLHADAQLGVIGDYFANTLPTVTGHNGDQTQVLRPRIRKSGCCGQNPQGDGSTQDAYMIFPAKGHAQGDLYISYWMKFQAELPALMTPQNWRTVFEWKTGPRDATEEATYVGDYRVILNAVSWGDNGLYWEIRGDNDANGGLPYQEFWRVENRTVPVPVNQWFKLEVFWHRASGGSGRVWMAVNGQVIADRLGANMGQSNAPINRIMVNQLYSGSPYPIHQWIDDLEIRSGFPVPGDNPPYAPH